MFPYEPRPILIDFPFAFRLIFLSVHKAEIAVDDRKGCPFRVIISQQVSNSMISPLILQAYFKAVVEQYNRDLAAWERQVREKQKPAQKEQAKPPERESVLKRLRQLQAEGKQRNQPRQRKKSFDRDSR